MPGAVLETIAFSLPSLIYLMTLRHRGASGAQARDAVGFRAAPVDEYGRALVVLGVTIVGGYTAVQFIPSAEFSAPGVVTNAVSSIGGDLAVVLRALGEEVFFRGLLGGILLRRLGFARGNAVQALIFLAPHCLLLLISTRLWPILPAQLVAGWLLGWLRHRSGSIGPSWFAHAGANLAAGLLI